MACVLAAAALGATAAAWAGPVRSDGARVFPDVQPMRPLPQGSERPGAAQPKLREGNRLLAAGRLTEAETAFREAARLAPKSPAPLLALADVALRRARPQDSEQLVREALALAPRSAEVAAVAGRVALALGKRDEARAQFERAIELDPGFDSPMLDLGELHMIDGAPALAEKTFRAALAVRPQHGGAHFGLGRALVALNRVPEAERAFAAAARHSAGNPLPLIAQAEVQAMQGRTPQALQTLELAHQADPSNPRSRMARGQLLLASGAHSEAIETFEQLLQDLSPHAAAAVQVQIGVAHQAKGDAAAAAGAYRLAIRAVPQSHLAHNNLAWLNAAYRLDLDEALVSARRAVELAPGQASYLDTLGFVHQARREWGPAVEAHTRATTGEPGTPAFQYRLGTALESAGRPQDAMRAYQAALASPIGFEEREQARLRLQALQTVPASAHPGRR
jgi:tetratricopeptide (TPR) repeat protein